MTIQQLSIFIENKSGTFQRVLEILKASNIQIIASCIADTTEYGICRIICSNPGRACEVLKAANISVLLSDVFAIMLDNQPGRAAETMLTFAEKKISISYLYSILLGDKGILIFRTDDQERARETIILNNLNVITEKDLMNLV